jgi:hypothetical protein
MTLLSMDNRGAHKECERCGEVLYGGSHYHCGGCDSTDVTSSYGHHSSGHFRDGKWVKTGFHHCPPGPCALLGEET